MNLDFLNGSQKEAVLTTEGPVMVMAGAGSGKTRVLTCRVAYLIEEMGVGTDSILAVTFTNKAAREMKDRISKMLDIDTKNMWISTFHSFAVRILRREIAVMGKYHNNFTIIDDSDSEKIIKQIIKENDLFFNTKNAINYISSFKNRSELNIKDVSDKMAFDLLLEKYNAYLLANNLLDFDDLILLTVELFENYPQVLAKYANKFSYIMIDEFQDTNPLQYRLISLLASINKNIFIVGDINQSIYSFRGARVSNVYQFKNIYNPVIIKLEENYRSTKTILNIANDIISKNDSFINMHLYTNGEVGQKAIYHIEDTSYGETVYVVNQIKKLVSDKYKYKDIAILYRLNSLSLNFENEFIKNKIPYVIYGGVGYFSRKEVKDIISYLRLIINPDDDFSFTRIVNVPKRKIGDAVVSSLQEIAKEKGLSLFNSIEYSNNLALKSFKSLIDELRLLVDKLSLDFFVSEVYTKSNYLHSLEVDDEVDRIDNIYELKSIMKDVMETYEGTNSEKLNEFLLDLALKTDTDKVKEDDNKVKLMNFHQAKGLEYPVVFMVAMEEGVFPSSRSFSNPSDLEEERRICYVGVTRAKERLYFTLADRRRLYGCDNKMFPSRFLSNIKKEYFEKSGYGVIEARLVFAHKDNNIKNKKENTNKSSAISIGDKICHKVFGNGVVVKADGNLITVAFCQEYGIKVLMANHPSITKLRGSDNEY